MRSLPVQLAGAEAVNAEPEALSCDSDRSYPAASHAHRRPWPLWAMTLDGGKKEQS